MSVRGAPESARRAAKRAAALLILVAAACSRRPGANAIVAIVDVTVIPMDSERALPHQTVLLRDAVIREVGPAASVAVPRGARRIEGKGRYLLPGLVDAHVHLRDPGELLSYLAWGVTTVVNLSGPTGNVRDVLALRARVARGELPGPTILTSGRILDGTPPIQPGVSKAVATPEEARRAVEAQIDGGVDLIKVYNNLPAGALRAVVAAAHRRGVAVWGHIPRAGGRETALQSALAAGIDVIAHGEELFFTRMYRDVEAGLDRGEVPAVDTALITQSVRLVREGVAAVVPNLSFIAMTRAQLEDFAGVAADPEARFLEPAVRAMWEQGNPTHRPDLPRFDRRERGKAAAVARLTRDLSKAGVPLLLGTDASAPGMYPGKSAHLELRLLVGAGLTPYQALAAATRDAGRVIGKRSRGGAPFGTIEAGRRADLLLLERDPVADVGNVAAIAGVFVRGQWRPRAELDRLREPRSGRPTN